jgi:hypothetical protein
MKVFSGNYKRGLGATALLLVVGFAIAGLAFEQKPLAATASAQTKTTCPDDDCTFGPDTCKQGYVWREADARDTVCVTPEAREQTRRDNQLAAYRREPNGGPYGPNTCKQGYVWREAFSGDVACVTPETRTQAKRDNRLAATRRACNRPT